MKILVTGGAGFIGSNIVDMLLENGCEVVVIDNLTTGKKENLNPSAKFYAVDILDSGFEEICRREKPSCIIHHAAQIDIQTSLRKPFLDAQVNILGTIKILEACVNHGIKKLVYASSAAVYGNPHYLGIDENHPVDPLSFYGISKHTPEHYIAAFGNLYGLDYTILRYANVYGPRQDPKGEGGVVSIFSDKLQHGQTPVIFGDGEQTRDFVYVKDVAAANLLALRQGRGEIVNISSNTQTTVNGLYQMLCQLTGSSVKPVYENPRPGDILHSYLDNAKALRVLGWKPRYDLYEGLRETVSFYSA